MWQLLLQSEQAIKDETLKVSSALFQPFIPGSIYVEAPSARHVELACAKFSGMMSRPIQLVSLQDAAAVVTCGTAHPSIKEGSWVRVLRGKYKNDLAFVRQITYSTPDELDDNALNPLATVIINLIPRINLDCPRRKRKFKTSVAPSRPEAHLFNGLVVSGIYETGCKRVEWDQYGKQQGDMWKFRGYIFRDGLLEMNILLTRLNFTEVNPTKEELEAWLKSGDSLVVLAANDALRKTLSEKRTLNLLLGDRVEVMRGWAMGRKGRVQKIDDAGVLIDDITNSSAAHALVSIMDIKKYIMVGDFVSVISGGNIGFDGWCLETKDGVALVSERGTCKEVSNLSSQHVPRSRS